MVLSGMQVKMEEGAMTISFAGKQSSAEIERLVNEKLESFEQKQQLALTHYRDAMQQQQLDTSTQLTQYLLTSSRQERREDFAELIKFINQQRSDDQLFYARQFNELQQEYSNPAQSGVNSSNK
jgi:ribosomal protein L11 methylase PrmA